MFFVLPLIEFIMHLKHEPIGYKINHPKGAGLYIFYHFINPVRITINDQTINTLPNACCIFSPEQKFTVEAALYPLLHDYVCFSTSSKLFFETKHLNHIFYPQNPSEISMAIEDIQYNYNRYVRYGSTQNEYVDEGINWLFLIIDQCFDKKILNNSSTRSDASLNELRSKMYTNVTEWSLDRMIKESNFCRSHFFRKYKECFGISPSEDILAATMREAKKLILYSNRSIQDIAFDLGYNSSDYFIRCFKKYYGISPGKLRNNFMP